MGVVQDRKAMFETVAFLGTRRAACAWLSAPLDEAMRALSPWSLHQAMALAPSPRRGPRDETLADRLRSEVAALESAADPRWGERWQLSDGFWRAAVEAVGPADLPALPPPGRKNSARALARWAEEVGAEPGAIAATAAVAHRDLQVDELASLAELFAGATRVRRRYGAELPKATGGLLAAITLLEHTAAQEARAWPRPEVELPADVRDPAWNARVPPRLAAVHDAALAALRRLVPEGEPVATAEDVQRATGLRVVGLRVLPEAVLELSLTDDRWPSASVRVVPSPAGVELLHPGARRGALPRGRATADAWALDRFLRLLLDEHSPLHADALRELGHAPWERFVDDLAEAVPEPDAAAIDPPRASAQRVEWRLSEGLAGWVADGRAVSDLTFTPWAQRALKSGRWSVPARRSLAKLREGGGLSELDERVAELLADDPLPAGRGVLVSTASSALRLLAEHPDVTWDGGRAPEPCRVLVGRAGVRVRATGTELCVEIVASERPLPAALAREPGTRILVDEERTPVEILVAEVPPDVALVAALLPDEGPLLAPASAGTKLATVLHRVEARGARVELPAELDATPSSADETPVVRLERLPSGGVGLRVGHRPLRGGPLVSPDGGPERLVGTDVGRRVFVQRDTAAERQRVDEVVAALGLDRDGETTRDVWELRQLDDALDAVRALQELGERGAVRAEWPADQALRTREADAGQLAVRLEKRQDWFAATGDLTAFEQRVSLAELTLAARDGRRWVAVDERSFVRLGDELRERLRALAAVSREARGRLELGPHAAPALDELAAAGGALEDGAAIRELRERLARARSVDVPVPGALKGVLRPYQREGFAWMTRLAAWGVGGCLADDMGLGKTVQALAVMQVRGGDGPQLVVAPTSVCGNWARETERFTPGLRAVLYEGADREQLLAGLAPWDVLVCSYALLARDADALAGVSFASAFFDEAQLLKNHRTQRSRAARGLDAAWRMALTGTPLENHLGDLWSLFAVVSPGLFGSWKSFAATWATPIERQNDARRREMLARALRPFLLRRRKVDVERDLPPRTEVLLPVSRSEDEVALYEAARRKILADVDKPKDQQSSTDRNNDVRFRVLAGLTRLRLLASHPRLDDPASTVPSSKLRVVERTLRALLDGGHRALVFSQFTSHLALVEPVLQELAARYVKLTGSTPAAQRQQRVDEFQRGDADVFLISLKAGGTGLNLTAADYVLHLDPWWNPAAEDQATDRAHRIGQDRPVTVYRFVARDTIEEKILALHDDKRALLEDVLSGADRAAKLDTDELLALMRR